MSIFKKIRFFFRFIGAFWQAHKKTIFWASVLGVFFTSLIFRLLPLFLKLSPQRIGIVGKYAVNEPPREILDLIGDGLTKVSEEGIVEPSLSSLWKIKNNGEVYTFTLKENLFWHDGKPVTSENISYNFSDVSLKRIDERTIEFELKEPFSPFPSVVSYPVLKKGLVGTGDYRVKSIKRNGQIIERMVLEPLDEAKQMVVYKFYPTEAVAKTAFKLGEVDYLIDLTDISGLEDWRRARFEENVNTKRVTAIIFNTQEGFLADKSLRQALAYGLQKKWLNRAYGPIRPTSWAYNPNLKRYDYDTQKAKELLEKSLPGDAEDFELALTTFSSLYLQAEEIVKDWEALGVKTKIEVVTTIPQEFQAFLVTEDIPPDPDQYLLWHSTQATNLSRFRSAQIDKLLEDGRVTLDQEKRQEIYTDFQRFLVEDAPAIFLYHPMVYSVVRE